jgi:hypothetical protein
MPVSFYQYETADVIAKELIAGPFGVIHPGCKAPLPIEIAKALVDAGKAEWPPIEIATETPSEIVAPIADLEQTEEIKPKRRITRKV